MHFTRSFKSSPHCVPSPDGTLVAALLASKIAVRSVETLETVHTVALPPDISGPVYAFQWSPSSSRLLVATVDQVHVFSAPAAGFHAVVRMPHSGIKPTLVRFGCSDSEILVFSQFGLKCTLSDLETSKSVEISNPKFFQAASSQRGFCFRPSTGHLALITRTAGKDIISIHPPRSREVQRSWHPETSDAQGILWTPDGRWLVIWESAALGHRLLVYTPDGHLFKTWPGPLGFTGDAKAYDLGAGVRLCQVSPDSSRAAVCDHTQDVHVLDMGAVTDMARLQHPGTITPRDTMQVWQEQIGPDRPGVPSRSFVKATQAITAPSRSGQGANPEPKSGCSSALFDSSSNLVATKLEDSPSTVWIWDLGSSAELRAVLIFHRNVSTMAWHPAVRELLLITCEGEEYGGLVFAWDPLMEGPAALDFSKHLPEGKVVGKTQTVWINWPGEPATLLFGDHKHYVMASLAESEQLCPPWNRDYQDDSVTGTKKGETSLGYTHTMSETADSGFSGLVDDDLSATDDTFSFKKLGT